MQRLDKELVSRGLIETRNKAKNLILKAKVKVNGQIITKPSTIVSQDDRIEILEKEKFVSRSGYKLEKAIKEFGINLQGSICLDIGASTGGFTDCMLQYGAAKVFAVDIGTSQLHHSLRNNEKIISMENTDARHLSTDNIPDTIDFFAADLSFISSTKVLPYIKQVLKPNSQGVLLIKPQFELSPEEVGHGIVKNPLLHQKAVIKVINNLEKNGFHCKDITFSPIKGGSGNIEYLAHLTLQTVGQKISENEIKKVIETAHKVLNQ